MLKVLFNEVFNSNTINAAKAKMAAIMQAAGETNEAIIDTLALMDKAFKGDPIADAEKTHMFKLLDLQSDFSTDYAEAPVEEDSSVQVERNEKLKDSAVTKLKSFLNPSFKFFADVSFITTPNPATIASLTTNGSASPLLNNSKLP